MKTQAVLGIFLGSIVAWAVTGTFAPRQPELTGVNRHRLAEAWPELEEPMKHETDGSISEGRIEERLLCGCIKTRTLLYCAICQYCVDHCQCTDAERDSAYHLYVGKVLTGIGNPSPSPFVELPSFGQLKARWRGNERARK
jgi:hypothetical protein